VPRTSGRYLTPEQASRVYDRIGRFQDWQVLYENRALQELLRLGSFGSAKSIFEFGCGTGAFAARILSGYAPSDCRYVGVDVSRKMVALSIARLSHWAERAEIKLSDGSAHIEQPGGAFDHFVSNYVFDLLAPEYAASVISEAHRILGNNGKLCLISLGRGKSGLARILTALWEKIWRTKPELVGGCRPVDLLSLLEEQWSIDKYETVTSQGITSEVVVATRH
jgi:ubiquinone/menaquinone biosynthesis C-methylase UbiE